jgi:choline kinase
MITVVKLVAGVGTRLLPLTDRTPKSLIDVGGGRTLLDRQLEAMAACGLRRLRLVTGYRSDQIEAALEQYPDFDCEIVYNPFYRVSDNLVSAWLGLRGLTGRAVLMNGDGLYSPGILRGLIGKDDDITMTISRKDHYDADDMKIVTEGPLIRDVGKDIDASRANGESVGLIAFGPAGLATMQGALERMIRLEDNLRRFYLSALRGLMRDEQSVHAFECSADDWAELDYFHDLEIVRRRAAALWRSQEVAGTP